MLIISMMIIEENTGLPLIKITAEELQEQGEA